jgi:hypothetical protein
MWQKKFVAGVLALTLAVLAAGCGGADKKGGRLQDRGAGKSFTDCDQCDLCAF